MSKTKTQDDLVPDHKLAHEMGISRITTYRWRKRGILPPAIVISGRNYTRRSAINRLKNNGDGSSPQKIAGGDA